MPTPGESADAPVRVHVRDGWAEIRFDRPRKHNALNRASYDAIASACRELRDREDIRALVLRGTGGRAFSSGNDIDDFVRTIDEGEGVAYEARVGEVLRDVFELPQVTIAVVEGICMGAGLALATHCDVRLATEDARFGYPIARTLGNMLSAPVLYRCVSVFGESLTREMLLLSRPISAQRAHAAGAIAACVSGADLDAAVEEMVAGIRLASRATITATKAQLLHRARSHEQPPPDDRDRVERVYGGADFAEGVQAFLAGRKPRFDNAE